MIALFPIAADDRRRIPVAASRLVTSSLLLGVLVSGLALPRILTEPFGINLPGVPPYLPAGAVLWAPLIAMVVLANGHAASGGRGLLVRIQDTDAAFVVCVAVWLALELLHAVLAGTATDMDLILQVVWLQVFYVAIRSFQHVPGIERSVVRYSILLITVGCAIQLLAFLQLVPSNIPAFEPFAERPAWSFVNRGAFLAAFGIILVYFFSDLRRQSIGWRVLLHSCAIVDLIFLLMTQSRGATVVLGLAVLVGGVAKLTPRMRRHVIVAFAALLAVGILTLEPNDEGLVEPSLYGRPLGEGGNMRLEMIRIGATTFVDHPLGGVGLEQAIQLRVEGFAVHTSYLLVLMAYGLFGAVGFVFFIRSFRPRRGTVAGYTVPIALVMLIGSMMFLPYLPWWYAVLGFVVREREGQTASG